jgi:hypothetical protein
MLVSLFDLANVGVMFLRNSCFPFYGPHGVAPYKIQFFIDTTVRTLNSATIIFLIIVEKACRRIYNSRKTKPMNEFRNYC